MDLSYHLQYYLICSFWLLIDVRTSFCKTNGRLLRFFWRQCQSVLPSVLPLDNLKTCLVGNRDLVPALLLRKCWDDYHLLRNGILRPGLHSSGIFRSQRFEWTASKGERNYTACIEQIALFRCRLSGAGDGIAWVSSNKVMSPTKMVAASTEDSLYWW